MSLRLLVGLCHRRNTRPSGTVQAVPGGRVRLELLLLWFLVHVDVRLKIFFVVQSVTQSTWMLDKTALSLLKSQALLLQHQLLALWTSVTAVVVLHVMVAVAAQTVVDLVEVLVTSVVVQTAVVHVTAQEMVHAQVEDLLESSLVNPVAVQLVTARHKD